MAVRRTTRRGIPVLFIDIRYRLPDGTRHRFRKDALSPTVPGARAEEKRYLLNIARFGTPYAPTDDAPPAAAAAGSSPPGSPTDPASPPGPPTKTFAEVVTEFRSTYMLTDLKVTTRRGYTSVLEHTLLPRFADRPLDKVDGHAAAELDLELSKSKFAQTTRNNIQVVLRSVLRFAVERGYLADPPKGLPRLKQIGQRILEIPTDDEVHAILAAARDTHRLSFALMAYAGLRPNEVRALRRRDMLLRWDDDRPAGGFLSVREGRSHGELHTPKTGQREIPIAPELARLLAPIERGSRDGHLALNERSRPWGQYGLTQAFERVRDRAGLGGWSIYALRHYAITSWLRAGVPVHVVQRMAGHKHLATTQRYVHHLKEDLEEAARRLTLASEGKRGGGNSGATGSEGSAGQRGRKR
ncbi:site-specific integrase [Polyangium sp. y55x31]|uniref:tyrosine-type recombinase/integrase n=1 Tax=Polyangium sp. y55x31 TaxID=3042688 RepID=UPI0024827703|nr:site-specific integrase [Polyangium sp. y55x31]MDI1476440.1 site-specific integrase [Polyangium sp. y55x31]